MTDDYPVAGRIAGHRIFNFVLRESIQNENTKLASG
jgi:hypothetical protein